MALNEFVLHILQGRLIELELPLEGAIRHALALTEERDDLIQNGIKVHARLSLPVAVRVCS